MLTQQTKPAYTLAAIKCDCGGSLSLLGDEEATTPPPVCDTKLFRCTKCKHISWCSPGDLGFEYWDDLEDFKPQFGQIK